jgi:site-specific recombinase XerD
MEKEKQTIDNLMDELFAYMERARYSRLRISDYRYYCQKLKTFMSANIIGYYDSHVGKAFLKDALGDFNYKELAPKEKTLVNQTEALSMFQQTKRLGQGHKKHPPKVFEGEIGRAIDDFISYRKDTLGLAKATLQNDSIFLYLFYCHMNDLGIKRITDISAEHLSSFAKQAGKPATAKQHVALNILRLFFRYLHDLGILLVDYSNMVPRTNYRHNEHLPSTFSDSEIKDLLNAIDRGNPAGKRNYAMILLAIRLGLRASDICGLKFEHIIWERNFLSLTQRKTGKPLELPLLPEIGNAIIDYLKYGRPVSSDSNCFLQVQAPYERITPSSLGSQVRRYMLQAGINYKKRKHGPHALRHCFASALLKEKVPLPVISELLGHKSMSSSMDYLRIDITSLRQCALEVPLVPSSFYKQDCWKGGRYAG